MRFLLALILGAAIGAAVVWYYHEGRNKPSFKSAGQQVEDAAKTARDSVQDQLKSWHLGASDISNDLARTGRVIRDKAQQAGQVISDATADARITAAIKSKLLRDSDLSAWNISVNTT